jgi:hypothetical protein
MVNCSVTLQPARAERRLSTSQGPGGRPAGTRQPSRAGGVSRPDGAWCAFKFKFMATIPRLTAGGYPAAARRTRTPGRGRQSKSRSARTPKSQPGDSVSDDDDYFHVGRRVRRSPGLESSRSKKSSEQFPFVHASAAGNAVTAGRGHRRIRPMVYILKGKVSWLRLLAII